MKIKVHHIKHIVHNDIICLNQLPIDQQEADILILSKALPGNIINDTLTRLNI